MDLLALALVVFIIGITPGPNNVVLMRLAAQRGVSATMPAIAGILFGGSALLVAVYAAVHSTGALLSIEPRWIALAGAAYLLVLGLQLMLTSGNPEEATRSHARDGFWSLLLLQFVNPKAWTFMLTLVAASWGTQTGKTGHGLVLLLATFVLVSLLCTTTWAAGGHVIRRLLQSPKHRARFDFCMGLVVSAYALSLPIQSGLLP
jgi:threonine/homoserine/homoserine lactone efflux protein